MSKDGFNAIAIEMEDEIYIPNISEKIAEEDGAVALMHFWGRNLGLKIEHGGNIQGGFGRPNCAPTREKAEEWWGEMAESHPKVGYEQGCARNSTYWEPHIGGTIMGGGKWHYGPVNDQVILEKLEKYN
jgi:hypothetical protein